MLSVATYLNNIDSDCGGAAPDRRQATPTASRMSQQENLILECPTKMLVRFY